MYHVYANFPSRQPVLRTVSSTVWFFCATTLSRMGLGRGRDGAEDIASDRSSKVDGRIVEWTIGTLSEDDVTERFFEAIPGFCDFKVVQGRLSSLIKTKIRQVMNGFLGRAFLSETISESTKLGRLVTCLNPAYRAVSPFMVSRTLSNIFDGR